jgi:hypothetical protein
LSSDSEDAGVFKPLQALLAAAVVIVVWLFNAFDGFLVNIAPPRVQEIGGRGFAIGLASFIALLLLLFAQYLTSFLDRAKWVRLCWAIIGVSSLLAFMAISLKYRERFETMTFPHTPLGGGPPTRMLAGTEYTPQAERLVETISFSSPEDLMQQAGAESPMEIWTRESILRTETSMIRSYQWLIITLCVALFAFGFLLVGGVTSRRERASAK